MSKIISINPRGPRPNGHLLNRETTPKLLRNRLGDAPQTTSHIPAKHEEPIFVGVRKDIVELVLEETKPGFSPNRGFNPENL